MNGSRRPRPGEASELKVGVQLCPQHCTVQELRDAWRAADRLPVDSIFVWDHFFPLSGPLDGSHFEAWSLLAAMAVDTTGPAIGTLVTCVAFRNPDLLADMACTVDQLSGGRVVLGMGAGWFEQDFREYGYEFGTQASRLRALESALPRVKARLAALRPGPVGDLPILVGGSGERTTLRLAADHAQMWNCIEPPDVFGRKNAVLDEWCAKLGRDPATIERTAGIGPEHVGAWEAFVAAGASHLIVGLQPPFDLAPVRWLLAVARGS
jgi:probable F420-dependent oxidoreductase